MNKGIWALFSVLDDFGQPDNNLEAWWHKKPNFDEIARFVGVEIAEKVLKDEEISHSFVTYRLRKIEEGKVKEEV